MNQISSNSWFLEVDLFSIRSNRESVNNWWNLQICSKIVKTVNQCILIIFVKKKFTRFELCQSLQYRYNSIPVRLISIIFHFHCSISIQKYRIRRKREKYLWSIFLFIFFVKIKVDEGLESWITKSTFFHTYRHRINLKIPPSEAELNFELISHLKTMPSIYEIYNASYLALVKFE